MGLAVALFLGVACASLAPLPEGNAFVRGLVGAQRQREEAVSLYTYDVTEVRDELDRDGRARRRETRAYEVFHVKGRPVRRLVAKDGRPLEGKEREKEERRVGDLATAQRTGKAASEQPGLRLSRILERYDFSAVGREELDERCAIVFDFAARPGDFDLERDGLLRRLAGRLWVDETERAVAQVEVRNTSSVRFALGLGATVSSLSLHARFRRLEEGAWLPRSLAVSAEGKKLLFKGFRLRTTTTYDRYRRFEVSLGRFPAGARGISKHLLCSVPFRLPGRLRGEPVPVSVRPFPFPFLFPFLFLFLFPFPFPSLCPPSFCSPAPPNRPASRATMARLPCVTTR